MRTTFKTLVPKKTTMWRLKKSHSNVKLLEKIPSSKSVYPKCHFVFLINWKTKFKILYLDFAFTSIKKTNSNNWLQSVYRNYNSFFDLKTKRILKIFRFSFFNFITKIEKWKNFLKFIFWFEIKKWIRKFCFLKLVLNQNRVKKKFFFRFSFFNALIKFEKWKIFFEIRFFISDQKVNYEIEIFILQNPS